MKTLSYLMLALLNGKIAKIFKRKKFRFGFLVYFVLTFVRVNNRNLSSIHIQWVKLIIAKEGEGENIIRLIKT